MISDLQLSRRSFRGFTVSTEHISSVYWWDPAFNYQVSNDDYGNQYNNYWIVGWT